VRKAIVSILILGAILFLVPEVHAFSFNAPPTKIIIPSVNISLPVYTAKVAFNTWEVRTDGASYGEFSTLPGNQGNTVIFSHALPYLFGNLPNIKKGDMVNVFTSKDWFAYKVTQTMVVDPENIEVIFSGQDHELTLYTCTGNNYEKRFVVKAKPVADLP